MPSVQILRQFHFKLGCGMQLKIQSAAIFFSEAALWNDCCCFALIVIPWSFPPHPNSAGHPTCLSGDPFLHCTACESRSLHADFSPWFFGITFQPKSQCRWQKLHMTFTIAVDCILSSFSCTLHAPCDSCTGPTWNSTKASVTKKGNEHLFTAKNQLNRCKFTKGCWNRS